MFVGGCLGGMWVGMWFTEGLCMCRRVWAGGMGLVGVCGHVRGACRDLCGGWGSVGFVAGCVGVGM